MDTPGTQLYSSSTRKTPSVWLGGSRLVVEGRSIPENPGSFYRPLFGWLMARLQPEDESAVLCFRFEYLNTASAKWVFLLLRDLTQSGLPYRLEWHYEKGDEDMLDLGIMLKTLLGCPFTSVEADEINI